MKPRNAALVVILVIVGASIGLYAAYPRITSTRISGITADPRSFDGKEVNLFGTIIEREEDSFVLADGTGTIKVEWAGTLPPLEHPKSSFTVSSKGELFR